MFKYIVLCLCVSLSFVVCGVLNLSEGSNCEWNDVRGKCVKETQCFTTLDTRGDKHPVCTTKGDVNIICCTDCELVNSTRNVVMSPSSGFYWKDGTKARDNCLTYLNDLPYLCRDGGFYSGISRSYDDKRKCHSIGLWGIGGAPPPNHRPGLAFPHQALLGFGSSVESAEWVAGGAIISNRFILTAANFGSKGFPKFVAMGIRKRSDSPTTWQTHEIKTFIPHPDYSIGSKFNDIALIETETTITFNKDVLPACLHVEAAEDGTATATYWRDPATPDYQAWWDPIQTVELEKFSEERCKSKYRRYANHEEINYDLQMCYGSSTNAPEATRALTGQPLLINTQFGHCIYAVIGVTVSGGGSSSNLPNLYTRVAHYKPWIESVVWA